MAATTGITPYGKNTSAASILKGRRSDGGTDAGQSVDRPYVVIDMGLGRPPEGAGPIAQLAPASRTMAELAKGI